MAPQQHDPQLQPSEAANATAPAEDIEPEDLAQEELEELQDVDPDPEPITYVGSDFDVEGLVRRLSRGDIVIPTFGNPDRSLETAGFQRRFVWARPQMDRFIESLLLGYPVPGVFFVQQADKRYLVLDGQQRLRTLQAFYEGSEEERPFRLQYVAERFKGLRYSDLDDETRRTLNNTFVQATIVRTDGSPASLEAVYQIFERLNSGGTQLTAHEIRVALYAGPFIEFLTELNADPSWRALYGPTSPRIRDQELILRFVALYISPGDYARPLKGFLNSFAARHRNLEGLNVDELRHTFARATQLLVAGPGRGAFRGEGRQVNAALTEAILVGLARRLDAAESITPAQVSLAVQGMMDSSELSDVVSRATADESSVRTRIAIATREFSRV